MFMLSPDPLAGLLVRSDAASISSGNLLGRRRPVRGAIGATAKKPSGGPPRRALSGGLLSVSRMLWAIVHPEVLDAMS